MGLVIGAFGGGPVALEQVHDVGRAVGEFQDDEVVRVRFVVFVEELIVGDGFEAVGAIEAPAGFGHLGDEELLVFGGGGVFRVRGYSRSWA